MVIVSLEAHVWSTKSQGPYEQCRSLGFNRYHSKKDVETEPYLEERKQYAEGRGQTWHLKNKLLHKIKDNLNELEELVAVQAVVVCKWESPTCVYLVLNSGVFVSVFLSWTPGGSYSHDKVFIDRTLVGKVSEILTHGVFLENFLILSGAEPKLSIVQFGKKLEPGSRLKKLSSLEPKVSSISLPGLPSARSHRLLQYCNNSNLLLVWWSHRSEGARAWSPALLEEDQANVLLYRFDGPKIDLLVYCHTKANPLSMQLSARASFFVYSVEQEDQRQTGVLLCQYKLSRNCQLQKISQTDIPLDGAALCGAFDPLELRLAVGCQDGTIVIHHLFSKQSTCAKAHFAVGYLSWHPDGSLLLACSKEGQLQWFDLALSCLDCMMLAEEVSSQPFLTLSAYFRSTLNLKDVSWCHNSATWGVTGILLLVFDRVPLISLRLCNRGLLGARVGPVDLVSEYLKCSQQLEATAILSCLNWNHESSVAMMCLNVIARYLLRQPLNSEREELIEAVLGTFHNPQQEMAPSVLLDYGFHVRCLTRKFFHLLLRYCRVERAFCLAVDLRDADLFMDLYYFGRAHQEDEMAAAAWEKAKQCRALAEAEHSDVSLCDTCSSSSDNDASSSQVNHLAKKVEKIKMNGHPSGATGGEVMVDEIPPFRDKLALKNQLKRMIGEKDGKEEDEGKIHVVHFGVV